MSKSIIQPPAAFINRCYNENRVYTLISDLDRRVSNFLQNHLENTNSRRLKLKQMLVLLVKIYNLTFC